MIEVKAMQAGEVDDLLRRVGYGHLGCARENHPYVLPIHYAYDEGSIYVFTTEGKKSEMIDANPEVCLQVEEVVDNENWASVIVIGAVHKMRDEADREKAYAVITAVNPDLTPALSFRWVDKWVRELKDTAVLYRIDPISMTGRCAGDVH